MDVAWYRAAISPHAGALTARAISQVRMLYVHVFALARCRVKMVKHEGDLSNQNELYFRWEFWHTSSFDFR